MKRAVHHQMRGMGLDRHVLLRGLAGADAVSKRDVAEQLGAGQAAFISHWEGKDVGRLILAAPGGIERPYLLVGGEQDRDLAVGKARMSAVGNRGMDRAAGEGGPVGAAVPF